MFETCEPQKTIDQNHTDVHYRVRRAETNHKTNHENSMKKTGMKTNQLTALTCGVIAMACVTSHAQLITSESFSGYSVGSDLPESALQPVVTGYTGNWTDIDFGNAEAAVIAGSLVYGGAGYAAGIGDRVGVLNNVVDGEINAANSGRTFRLLNSSLAVTDLTAGTRYVSWLFQSGQETGATTYQMLDLYDVNTADANRNFTAGITDNGPMDGTQYDFGVDEAYTSTGVAANSAVHLFVVRFDLSATALSDSVTVWLDPTLGAGDPAGGVTVSGVNLTFDRQGFSDYEGNSANWDEVRWGSSFGGVTIAAVPEPGTLALLLGGLGSFLGFRRARKNRS